ncbi:MAG TPA: ATP synthase subunit I [Terriglobales bacterium]|nr:ATP synthase subunit I [Terriglobales bacterium]
MSLSAKQTETESERFYSAAYLRIVRFSMVLLSCLTIVFWFALDHGFALGWLAGGVVAIVNFLSLKKLVIAFADRVIASGGTQRSSGLVLRFLLRYGLVAVVAYGIFRSSAMSASGLLAGLTLPALAIMIEAGYELSMYLRRGY